MDAWDKAMRGLSDLELRLIMQGAKNGTLKTMGAKENSFGAGVKAAMELNRRASLDAAMTLADGFGGEVTFFKDGTAKAFLWQPYPMAIEAKAASPALALCAAALRAQAAKEG